MKIIFSLEKMFLFKQVKIKLLRGVFFSYIFFMASRRTGIRIHKHKNVGRYFRAKRIKAGLSQEAVAKALNYTSIQIVSNWERGLCSPPGKILKNLSKLYKIDKMDIMEFLVSQSRIEYLALLGIKNKANKSKPKVKRRK